MRMCGAIKSTVQLFMRSHKNMHHPSVLWEKLGTASSVLMFLKGKHPYNFTSQSNTIRLLSNSGHREKGRERKFPNNTSISLFIDKNCAVSTCTNANGDDAEFRGGTTRWGGILGLVCIMATLIAASLALRVATDIGQ